MLTPPPKNAVNVLNQTFSVDGKGMFHRYRLAAAILVAALVVAGVVLMVAGSGGKFPGASPIRPPPNQEILEVINRIEVPSIERARLHFDEAIGEHVIEMDVEPGYHWQRDMRAVLEWLEGTGTA